MAMVIKFPNIKKEGREHIKTVFREMLQDHEPETRDIKYKALMDIYDRHFPLNIPITLESLQNEPFTAHQIEVITKAMYELREECNKRTRGVLMEAYVLQILLIDRGGE